MTAPYSDGGRAATDVALPAGHKLTGLEWAAINHYGEPSISMDDPSDYEVEIVPTDTDYGTPVGAQPCANCERILADYAQAITDITRTIEHMTARSDAMVENFNTMGIQLQTMWDGIGGLMKFFQSIAGDLDKMSMTDKLKLAAQLARNGRTSTDESA